MGLFTNIGGELKELSSLAINVGGEKKEINSLTANIGGQPKEIFTMLPKPITGTYHLADGHSSGSSYSYYEINNIKLPINHKIKVKITINILDGYLYKIISSSKRQFHSVSVAFGYYYINSNFVRLAECGTKNYYGYDETKTTYTTEKIFLNDTTTPKCIHMRRWAGTGPVDSDGALTAGINYYANNLLSFDYSIEFEPVYD